MTPAERERFKRQMADMAQAEEDERDSDPARRLMLLGCINRKRIEAGKPHLLPVDAPPDVGLHERARALGLLSTRR